MLTLYEYSDENMNPKACLVAFVIELKKRLENKESLKVNISESIYNKISNTEFKEIFYDQINEIAEINTKMEDLVEAIKTDDFSKII